MTVTNKLKIFTVVWGQNHLDWFERSCIRSLCWPLNKQALNAQDTTWTLFTKQQDVERAQALAAKTGIQNIEFAKLDESVKGNDPSMGRVLLECLLEMIEASVKGGAKVLMAPPDTIFSDGSVQNLISLSNISPYSCVQVPHMRVSPSIFGGIRDEQPLSGAALTTLALKHGHKAWTDAEDFHPKQNSFIGGISWRRLNAKMIAVTHRLPTVYLAQFLPSDLSYFRLPHDGLPPTFGAYDHTWPSVLLKQERIRSVGSSDAACIVEVTKEDLNVPPVVESNIFEPDAFWREKDHNKVNRQFLYIMRED